MDKVKQFILATAILTGLASGAAALVAQPVSAQADVITNSCNQPGGSTSPLCDDGGKELFGDNSIFENITNIFLFVVGAVSVIMIVVGGFRYSASAGDQAAVTSAKNTIFYAVIGLVVALMAYAIVNFVITNI